MTSQIPNRVERRTFCRICEPMCPIIAESGPDGRVTKLRPSTDDPVGGTACQRGLSYLDIHNDPDRLNYPLRRMNPRTEVRGEFQRADWDEVLVEAGRRIRAIVDEHGPNSVAFYLGNPLFFNGVSPMMATQLREAMGCSMLFTANAQDAANRYVVADLIYGSDTSNMIPDIYNTHYLLCIGGNPRVSKWTGIMTPNDFDVVESIVRRGGKVRFVNPRVTESSTAESGPTLQIRPGTDLYFLTAVFNELHEMGGFDSAFIARHATNVDGAIAFAAQYPAARVEGVTGISAAQITEVALEIAAAPSACVYTSLGVNQSRQGVLAHWMAEMINLVTGNLGRRGGTIKPPGLSRGKPQAPHINRVETSVGVLEMPSPAGSASLPCTLLPDLIEGGDIKVLLNLGGNPLLSFGGEERQRAAYAKLDVLLSIDIFRSTTVEMSDYALPDCDWIERPDIATLGNAVQTFPNIRYSQAMEPPAFERRNAWWALARLAQEIGVPSPLDDHPDDMMGDVAVNQLLGMRDLSIEQMVQQTAHVVIYPEEAPDALFERAITLPDQRVQCFPDAFRESGLLKRATDIFEELLREEPGTLKLISLRTRLTMNSWLANSDRFRRGRQAENPLHICSEDAVARGLDNGDEVRVANENGDVEAMIFIDDSLRPGTVAMTHGFGHRHSFALRVAQRAPGANYNQLAPIGPGVAEPLSNLSWLNGIPVTIKRLDVVGRTKSAN